MDRGACDGSLDRAVAGIGRTKIYQAIADGSLKARECGKRTLVLRDDLRDFLASLPGAA